MKELRESSALLPLVVGVREGAEEEEVEVVSHLFGFHSSGFSKREGRR
jgi:hypothetical protein